MCDKVIAETGQHLPRMRMILYQNFCCKVPERRHRQSVHILQLYLQQRVTESPHAAAGKVELSVSVSLYCVNSKMCHSQFQQFSPQLILRAVLVARRFGLTSHGVLPGLINKRQNKVRKLATTTTEHEDIILLLLLCFRDRQFSHLVEDRRQGHSQRRCLATAKGQQH